MTPVITEDLQEVRRSFSSKNWRDSMFVRYSDACSEKDDIEALKWAAIEKLPTYNRLRTSILRKVADNGKVIDESIDVTKLAFAEKQEIIHKLLSETEEDNERFLLKLRERIDRVGIELPKIEVRFENLKVDADVRVGRSALPTLFNFTVNILQNILSLLRISSKKMRVLKILDDISGIVKPSRMTLLLGPPSSGKTTFLLAIAGKLEKNLRVSGQVKYNGYEPSEFVPQRTSAYISQYDLHISEMTVRETLDFSGCCQGVGTRYEMLMELSRREKLAGITPDPDLDIFMKATAVEGQQASMMTDYVLKLLGLDNCADTLVGDQMRRGISGGQRKRLTTGEMLVGPAKVLLMDEISTGLDSSTTYQIVKCLRQTVHVLDGTIIISLLQPAPETYELFDDLILLSEGQIVYQGPCSQVLEFFQTMGFRCPERKGVADFLQEVTSKKDQEQYWADREQPYQYVSVKDFADAFSRYALGDRMKKELARPFDKSKSHPAALITKKYALKNLDFFKVCAAREWILIKRNVFIYVFKTVQLSVMATFAMTTFLRTKMHQNNVSDGNLYVAALFYGLVVVMFNGFAELSLTVLRLPIFYKQRDCLFYPSWAYSLATWIIRIPLSFLESFIWVFLTYWVIGFDPAPGRFFRQLAIFFFLHHMALGLFRCIANVARTMVLASTFGTFSLLVLFVLGGFIISRDNIHPWWIWGYWISPLMYGQNANSVNELLGSRWQKPSNGSHDTIGVAILKSRGLYSDAIWYWIGVGALIGFSFVYNILSTLALTYLDPLGKPQPIIPEAVTGTQDEKLFSKKLPTNLNAVPQNRYIRCFPKKTVQQKRQSHFLSGKKPDSPDAAAHEKRGMVLPFQPLSMVFDNVNYYIDMPTEVQQQGEAKKRLQLLCNVSGAFEPGVLTALVGVSGAGKTTLMDVLAGRKTGGVVEGSISISGFPKKQETFARISGYCEQNDIHSPNVTVHESLVYSAWLRLPREVDQNVKEMFVEEIMELVELNSLREAMVGIPGVTGLSTEQRKRLTIAVELVANPSIIFMDEPTSGLDARAAAIVMRTVRNTVDTGRTVVCTIHQPSIDIFEAFDELLLLKRGGQVIYEGSLGKRSYKLIDYFQAIDGIPTLKEGSNPATWMLEVTSQSAEARLGIDFADIYSKSALYRHNQERIKELCIPEPGSKDLAFESPHAQSFTVQCLACLWKQHKSYWRNPLYCVVRMFFTTICALMFGTIFWNLGKKRSTEQDLFNLMGSMYAATLFIGVNNSSSVQPVVAVERTVFYRERAAGMYSAFPYAFAQVVIEIPYVTFQAIVYALIVYSMISFEWTLVKFLWYFFFTCFALMYFTFYGMMVVSLTPNSPVAAVLSSAFYGFWNLFSGFLIARPLIPIWWRWYSWANPVAWTLYGLITSQLGDVESYISIPGESVKKPVRVYLAEHFGFHKDFLGAVASVHIGLVLLFACIFAYAIKILNFQRR
ncbi:hypothetical protein O6H91_08G025200 [Diphasiastrum complanatum]|uniref:Uncharacterized protein n=1 Tax=Diphasiastrum complanatum TaxID=34168 RepID=A0ACC2CVZ3_DIPCM|nr:hypothetical protein O6H91_08G025200 [Diphasiastrum complanatum]